MKLKQGRNYLNGYGQTIQIVDTDDEQKPYIFIGSDGEAYTEDGIYNTSDPDSKSNLTHMIISDKEVDIMQATIDALQAKIEAVKNCLVCAAIADMDEIIVNTLDILEDRL